MIQKKKILISAAFCLNDQGELLLLKRAMHKPEGGTWGLVGGKQEDGESSLDACLREAKEEIGVDLSQYKPRYRGNYLLDLEKMTCDMAIYVVCLPSDISIQFQKKEVSDFAWKSIKAWREHDDLMQGMYPLFDEVEGKLKEQGAKNKEQQYFSSICSEV